MSGHQPTVRILLVEGIIWWVQGRLHAGPGPVLSGYPAGDLDRLYAAVAAEAAHGCGQSHIEWVMEHLAQHGDAYMAPDGTVTEANVPADHPRPSIPAPLLQVAVDLYRKAEQLT